MEDENQEPENITTQEKENFCPKIETTNNNMGGLPYNEKLNIIEEEVHSLYEFCLEKKFTKHEIYNCVSAMYGPKKSVIKKTLDDSGRHFVVLSVIVAVVAILMVQRESWTIICATSKLFAIKILPYWDWASLYREDCFIANEWAQKEAVNITSEFCKYCDHIDVQKLSNVNRSSVTASLANKDFRPFVVRDVLAKQPNIPKLSISEIMHMYRNHPILSSRLEDCAFQNNAGHEATFYDFFDAYTSKTLPPQWHANWANCDAKAAKVIRGYHPRPYFLPLMMQLESENIMVTSLGADPTSTFVLMKDASDGAPGMLFSVLSGSLRVTLQPNEECIEKFRCSQVVVDIVAGESLFYVVDYWSDSYSPIDSGITIAIANAVAWDEM